MKWIALVLVAYIVLSVSADGRPHPDPLPPKFVAGAKCIQSHEGSWQDPNPPYWGGMQMDMGFMETYGTWLLRNVGTADNWTPHQQLHIAYRAYKGWKGYPARGFSPWPNTRRMCGV